MLCRVAGAWGRAPQIYSVRLVCPKNNACVTLQGRIVFLGNSKRTLYAQDQIQIVERKLSKSMFVRVNARFSTLNVHLLLQTCVYFVNSPKFFYLIVILKHFYYNMVLTFYFHSVDYCTNTLKWRKQQC